MTCLVQSTWMPDALAVVYTNNTSQTARIDKFEARNNDTLQRSIAIHLVGNGAVADNSTIRLTDTIAPGDTLLCEALVGHDLNSGDSIYALASATAAVSFRVSGRLV